MNLTNILKQSNAGSKSQANAISIANCFDGEKMLYRQQSDQLDYINKQIQGYCLCDAYTCRFYNNKTNSCDAPVKRKQEVFDLYK